MNKEEILNQVGFDLDKAKQIYAWLNEPTSVVPSIGSANQEEVVSIVDFNGQQQVRVHAGKYDFVVSLKEAEDEMNWDDAMKYAEDQGMRLFTLEEGLLMFCFKDEINAAMEKLGGDPLNEDSFHWSGTEIYRNIARTVYFFNGSASNGNKGNGFVVRPVAAFTCVS